MVTERFKFNFTRPGSRKSFSRIMLKKVHSCVYAALFRSLLYEACGRTINPVSGGIGLMWTGNWDLCQAAADAVLRGESLRALSAIPAAFTDRDMDGLYGSTGVAASSSSPEDRGGGEPTDRGHRWGQGRAGRGGLRGGVGP